MDVVCCAMCKGEVLDNGVLLTQTWVDGLNEASKKRGDTVDVVLGDTIHKNCRRDFTCPSSVRKAKRSHEQADHTPRLFCSRNSLQNRKFDFTKDCSFCGNEIDEEEERKGQGQCVGQVRLTFRNCDKRVDDWAEVVRAESCMFMICWQQMAYIIMYVAPTLQQRWKCQSNFYPACLIRHDLRNEKLDDRKTQKPVKFFSR